MVTEATCMSHAAWYIVFPVSEICGIKLGKANPIINYWVKSTELVYIQYRIFSP